MSKTYRNRRKRTEYTKSVNVPMLLFNIGGLILVLVVTVGCRSTPQKRFVSTSEVFELRKDLRGDYDKAWEAIVKAVDRWWIVKNMNKDSGYIWTAWVYRKTQTGWGKGKTFRGRSKTVRYKTTFRTRLVIQLQSSAITFKMRTESQKRRQKGTGEYGRWLPDTDGVLHPRTYYGFINEVGRTVLNEY